MNLSNLRCFVSVVDEMSISKAAKNSFISQQSMSQQINSLEKELGARLFTRSPRLSLTAEGACFEKFARQVLLLESDMRTSLDEISRRTASRLTVCIGPTRSRLFMPSVLSEFNRLYPDLEIKIVTGPDSALNSAILNGDADLYIGSSENMDESFERTMLYTEHICLVIADKLLRSLFPDAHEQYAKRFADDLDISLFKEAQFLLPMRGAKYRALIDAYFDAHDFTPRTVTESNNMDVLTQLSLDGMGLAFVTTPHAMAMRDGGENRSGERIHIFPISDMMLHIAIARRAGYALPFAAKCFLKVTLDMYPSAESGGA